jgi:subtilase family serine protease
LLLDLVIDEKYYSATPQLDCPAFRIWSQGFPRVSVRNRAPDPNNSNMEDIDMQQRPFHRPACLPIALTALGFFALMAGSAFAAPAAQATNMSPENESKQISVTVWLNPNNKAALDTLVEQMYDKSSSNYHKFLTMEEIHDQFAPTAKQVGVVRNFLAGHNMQVTSTGAHNLFVVAKGSVGDAQTAFNTKINRMMVNGTMHRVTASVPSATGPAAALIGSVQGLSDLQYRANVQPSMNPATKKPFAGVLPSAAGADGLFFSGQCLRPAESQTFKTGARSPVAIYFGNRYGADITNTSAPDLPPCGYDAAEMQQAYGLTNVYKKGLDGSGQTIVIVDAFGSNSIMSDANLFSQLNNLPALTSSNFKIVTPLGPVTCTATNGCISGNWQFETTLDVEWAHAIAPGANIVLVLSPDNSFTNLDLTNFAAVENQFGNVLSNSFGISEIVLEDEDPAELVVENSISELAAALGIAHNVSTGDTGDNLAVDQSFGIDAVSPGANADSPFATGVGGTSTFLNSKSNIELQTGWGLNLAEIAGVSPNPPILPPVLGGFLEGASGGTSTVYAKPAFQKRLPGKFRLEPDIAMNADPQTGNEIIVSPDGNPADGTFVEVFGGTSLACPMFSAFWAIANQAAGGGPIGQAAPVLYELPGSAITDVNLNPISTLLDVTGVVIDPPHAPTFESAAFLGQPQKNTKLFISALFQSNDTNWDVLTFGTDSSLATGPGWDNVTGLGTPNGVPFVDSVVQAVQ